MKMRNSRDNCVGCCLPNGNVDEFQMIRSNLVKMGINFAEVKTGWFLISPEDVPKLPVWKKKPFLPVDKEMSHGHSVYEINARSLFGMLKINIF